MVGNFISIPGHPYPYKIFFPFNQKNKDNDRSAKIRLLCNKNLEEYVWLKDKVDIEIVDRKLVLNHSLVKCSNIDVIINFLT